MKNYLTQAEYQAAEAVLDDGSLLDLDFFVLILFSCVICFLGFLMDSPTVIIGAMVISPLLTPFVGLSSALVAGDVAKFSKVSKLILLDVFIVLTATAVMAYFFKVDIQGSEVVSRLAADPMLYFIVAVFCGLAGSFGFFWPKVKESVIGVGISVALIPPAVLFGISLVSYPDIVLQTGIIMALNLLGIIVGATIMIFILKHLLTRG